MASIEKSASFFPSISGNLLDFFKAFTSKSFQKNMDPDFV